MSTRRKIFSFIVMVTTLAFTALFVSVEEYVPDHKAKFLMKKGEFFLDYSLFCAQNPYTDQLMDDWKTISRRIDSWLEPPAYQATIREARNNETWKEKWNAFQPFKPMSSCKPSKKICVGGSCRSDQSKITCGLGNLQAGCVVYSIGSNNQWEFELDILIRTPCRVHSFDCTGPRSRFQTPQHERLEFHHVCLGTIHENAPPVCRGRAKCGPTWTMMEIQQHLGHKQVDLHKMDIEGFEWPIFQSWQELSQEIGENGTQVALPMQLLVEVHYKTRFPALWKDGQKYKREPFKDPDEIVELQAHLLRMGYIVIERDDNNMCPHCTELTLLRVKC